VPPLKKVFCNRDRASKRAGKPRRGRERRREGRQKESKMEVNPPVQFAMPPTRNPAMRRASPRRGAARLTVPGNESADAAREAEYLVE